MPLLVVILALTSAFATGPAPDYTPVSDEAYTLDLEIDGYVNGAMDKNRMMTLNGCTLERDAAYMYALLMEAAERDGIELGWEDCYRSYNVQKASYEKRCPYEDQPVFETDPLTGEKIQTGSKAVRVCSGPPIARAGFSNHGWGRAVDFTSGRSVLSCNDRAFRWLQGNAHRFGWVHPRWAACDRSTREPWHWEYAGVTDPNLVDYNRLNLELLKSVE
ncbi:MAG TPA: M15 family metallopeptidase [Acidimicrobiia bacterium]|nr:M15 family metallopeptidase [Acidimicrobiia bacterium]